MPEDHFKRYEKKYLLTAEQYTALLKGLKGRMQPDRYGESQICSLYYDTPDYRLIRASLDKPVYKEKLRLRCYGVPEAASSCFIELKKKYQGIVYKRRIYTNYRACIDYMAGIGTVGNAQIAREIDYFLKLYPALQPAMACFYNRTAYYSPEDEALRITFDRDIRCRSDDLDLSLGAHGHRLFWEETYLMEIKIPDAMPLWLAELLDRCRVFPTSFSKYGTAYRQLILPEIIRNGAKNYAEQPV